MKPIWSRMLVIAPAVFLLVVGVSSIAFAWGASSAKPARVMPPQPSAAAHATVNPPARPGGVGGGAAANLVSGTVAGKTSSTIVITTTAGKSITIDIGSSTRFLVRGVTNATIADVAVGSAVVAQGTYQSDGTFSATAVQLGGRIRGGRGFGGEGGGGGTRPQPSAGASGVGI